MHDAAVKPATARTIRTVSVNTWGPGWATVECCVHPLDWQSWIFLFRSENHGSIQSAFSSNLDAVGTSTLVFVCWIANMSTRFGGSRDRT